MTQDLLRQCNESFETWESAKLALDDFARLKNVFAGQLTVSLTAGGYTCQFRIDGEQAKGLLSTIDDVLTIRCDKAKKDFGDL